MSGKWLAAANLFGDTPAPRMHWYPAEATVSSCGNHHRPWAALTWAEDMHACPRCIEALRFAGELVMPLPPQPPAEPPIEWVEDADLVDEDDSQEDEEQPFRQASTPKLRTRGLVSPDSERVSHPLGSQTKEIRR